MLGSAFRTLTVFIVLFILTTGLSIYVYLTYAPASPEKVIASTKGAQTVYYPSPAQTSWYLLNGIIQKTLEHTSGSFSIVIINLQTGERFTYNDHRTYLTASLYKLWIMATVYKQIEEGVINTEMNLTEDISTLNNKFNIATESAEKTEGIVSMTVGDAIERMITYSDNYSALLLSAKIRLSRVDNFLRVYGFTESKAGTALPTTTASDIALFYEKLYRSELADNGPSAEMLQLLKKQQIKRKLPKYLPSEIVIAHKTGELDQFTHDAGIVYTPRGNYIISVLSESKNPKIAEEQIAEISLNVFNFILNQP